MRGGEAGWWAAGGRGGGGGREEVVGWRQAGGGSGGVMGGGGSSHTSLQGSLASIAPSPYLRHCSGRRRSGPAPAGDGRIDHCGHR